MARKVDTHETASQRSRQSGLRFFRRLILITVAACIICGAGLAYLWFWLERYEAHSVNGAIQAYFDLVDNEKWDRIYDIDIQYFEELNSRADYIEFLKSVYGERDTKEMKYSFVSTNGVSEYYDVHYDYYVMASLELKREDIYSPYHVKTVGYSYPAIFEVLAEDARFTVNGTEITDFYYHEDDAIASAFEGYALDYRIPTVKKYFINSLVAEPIVRGIDKDVIAVKDRTSDSYFIGHTADSEQASEFAQNMYDTAVAYAKFVTRDGSFYNLSPHLLQGTELYNNIASFDNSWVTDHDSIEFDDVHVYDLIPIGENAFIGTITFDYKLIASDVSGTYKNSYQMFFIKNGQGYWKMVDMAIISDDVNVDIG